MAKKSGPREIEHEFRLVLTGGAMLTPETEDALFAAGCDDATVSSRSSRVVLTFSRKSRSLKDAIQTAVRDVRQANIAADVLRIESLE